MKKIAVIVALALGFASGYGQSVYPGQHKGKLEVEANSTIKAESFDLKDVRLLPGRVHDNLKRDSAWMSTIEVNRLLLSFRNNAGLYAGVEGGESVKMLGGWETLDCELRGHTTGHLLSAYGLMYAATGDELFKQKGDSLVAGLAEVQAALGDSGYLSAFPEEHIDRNLQGKRVWAPWYTLHKLFSGLIDQYLYSDNEQSLLVAKKMGDWAYGKLIGQTEETRRLMLRNEFGGVNESFYNLYSATGDERYKQLAQYFYHNEVIDPFANGDADFGTKHANTLIPKVIGEARNYELTGEGRSHDIINLFWHEIAHHHSFVTGSLSQKEHFFDTDKFSEFINGYTGESCCTYNMLKLSRHMFCLDPSAEIADYYERALYNHILAQQDPETGLVCYFMPLKSGVYKVYCTPENSFWCCVSSAFESHAKYAEFIYYHSDNDLYVNLFIPSKLSWKEKGLELSQHTEFPTSDIVNISIDKASSDKVNMKLRYPSWSGKPEVKVNGEIVAVTQQAGSYISIDRIWNAGDKVEVRYPMSIRLEATPDDPNKAAVLYGPVVLAGDMGQEGVVAFSDPNVKNDYYTYDYHIPGNIDDTLAIDIKNPGKDIVREGKDLRFRAPEGKILNPLYDTHRKRYAVYWSLKDK